MVDVMDMIASRDFSILTCINCPMEELFLANISAGTLIIVVSAFLILDVMQSVKDIFFSFFHSDEHTNLSAGVRCCASTNPF